MKKLLSVLFCTFVYIFCVSNITAQEQMLEKRFSTKTPVKFNQSTKLQSLLDSAINQTLENFKEKNLKPDEFAATLIDLRNPDNLLKANYRSNEQIYPASVVKMFYMAALYRQLKLGIIKMTPELQRALENMIIDSGNESTGYILDVLTGTSSGAEMPAKEFEQWKFKRNLINRYYQSLGYTNINVNQKTHCEDAWGVEQQFRNYKGDNRNMLTTDATARLLTEIVLGKSVTPDSSKKMMDLMKRDWDKPVNNQFDQEFVSHAVKPGTKIWSKAGWTSKTRHDAAYIETPEGLKFVLVIFTENHGTEQEIIPSIARKILEGLGEIK